MAQLRRDQGKSIRCENAVIALDPEEVDSLEAALGDSVRTRGATLKADS
jgi:hypothetical protein